MGKDDETITVKRSEWEALRSKGMSKEERQLRTMIREEVAAVIGEVFDFGGGGEGGEGERKPGGLLKAVGSFLGGEGAGEGDEHDED